MIKLVRTAVLAAFVIALAIRAAHGEELNIFLKSTPAFERLRPYADPATLSLLVTDASGRPESGGTVTIRLDAPRSQRFFSTDFPWVEGTRLQEMTLNLRQGRVNWKYLFPIRGQYRLGVEATSPDGRTARKEFTFTVRENEKKWWTLAAFSAALFCIGAIAGRVFTGARNQAAAMMAVVALAASGAMAAGVTQDGDGEALEVEPATVGRPTLVRVREGLDSRQPGALLSLAIIHLEKSKTAFEIERVPTAGDFSMKFQFTDGAEYRLITVVERPGVAPLRSEKIITAASLEPPTSAMVPAFIFFIGLIAVGLAAGRWSKRDTV